MSWGHQVEIDRLIIPTFALLETKIDDDQDNYIHYPTCRSKATHHLVQNERGQCGIGSKASPKRLPLGTRNEVLKRRWILLVWGLTSIESVRITQIIYIMYWTVGHVLNTSWKKWPSLSQDQHPNGPLLVAISFSVHHSRPKPHIPPGQFSPDFHKVF